MLTPAIAAYGLPIVIFMLVVVGGALVVLVVDFHRWTGHRGEFRRANIAGRDAARRRHPAGRHRAPIPRPLDAGLRPRPGGRPL